MTYRSSARRLAHGVLALVVALGLLLAPARASAGPSKGDAHARYLKGKQRFDAGDYKAAIAHFEAADRIAPSPVLQYNIGLAYERMGDKAEAVARYRRYVDAMPDADNRAAVEAKLARLSDELAAEQPLEPPFAGEAAPAPSGGRPDGVKGGGTPAAPKAEANDSMAVPLADLLEPTDKPGVAPATPPSQLGTERAADVDVGAVRDERRASGAMAMRPGEPAIDEETPPPIGSYRGHRDRAPEPAPAPSRARPLHRQWWFWVAVGVGAIVLVDIASAEPDEPGSRALEGAPRGDHPAAAPRGIFLRF
jgi:hypothetical protein